ncbi:hypothetical protein [Chitinilyticum aquatile]|uniref:hypothetical protein n=1 Tax=Chitinilyticum aquatile TaxID=362520 RepID=UPI000421F9B9|nr:hypothetical protein [Chitinilyticum aquatile]
MDYNLPLSMMCSMLFLIGAVILWAGFNHHQTTKLKWMGDRPASFVLLVLLMPFVLMALFNTVPAIYALVVALGAWLFRRPMVGLRGHLWGFVTVPLVPAMLLIYAAMDGRLPWLQALDKSAVLLSLVAVVLLVDKISEYRSRHGIAKR